MFSALRNHTQSILSRVVCYSYFMESAGLVSKPWSSEEALTKIYLSPIMLLTAIYLDYSRVEVAVAARPQPMKL